MATNTPDAVAHRITANIQDALTELSKPLDAKAFGEAEQVLPRMLQSEPQHALINTLATALPTLQQDATPAINLLIALLQDTTYTGLLALPPDTLRYVDGLAPDAHMTSFNRLTLTLLAKATTTPADAAHVASLLDTMRAIVRLWLCTPDAGIAAQASRLLRDLLAVDLEVRAEPGVRMPAGGGGQGLVWKRVFGDRDVYQTFFEACSLTGGGEAGWGLSRAQRTLAQARLMEWLPAVGALDWGVVVRSHHSLIEKEYGVKEGGLLEFATSRMVDYKDDVLMHRCLIDFYSDLLYHSMKASKTDLNSPDQSPALQYLILQGLHARTAAMYLQLHGSQLDAVESMFLYGPSANYIATYASSYPAHFLASQMPGEVSERLSRALDLSPGQWMHGDSPKHDLHLLASLPRESLLLAQIPQRNTCILGLLPCNAAQPDVLNTLASVFHGPTPEPLTFPAPQHSPDPGSLHTREAAAARVLYFNYLASHRDFWAQIVAHADTVALKDVALAALNCLLSVLTATWAPTSSLPLTNAIATPESGHVAILTPPALQHTLDYLLRPPRTFTNLVGGRGDSESAAFQIASKKFEALGALHARLREQMEREPGLGYEEILATIGGRLAKGPFTREGEVGGRVGTLDA